MGVATFVANFATAVVIASIFCFGALVFTIASSDVWRVVVAAAGVFLRVLRRRDGHYSL